MVVTASHGVCRPVGPCTGITGQHTPGDTTSLTVEAVTVDRVDASANAEATCRLLALLITRYLLAEVQQDSGGAA